MNDMKIKRYSTDNLKELNKEINEKIFTLLDKVKRTNLTSPCILNFVFNNNTGKINITITHRKQDNRLKDIPKNFRSIYKEEIPDEDFEYFYFNDPKKGYSNLIVSPDFVFTTNELDMTDAVNNIKDGGFLLFPRTVYNTMKANNKMLFKSLDFEIKDDKLIVNYELFSKKDVLLRYIPEMESLMEAQIYPVDTSFLPEDMKAVIRKFYNQNGKERITYSKLSEDLKEKEKSVLKLPYGRNMIEQLHNPELMENNLSECVELFYDFIIGSPKSVEYVQIYTPNQDDSDVICSTMVRLIYNGWNAYYIYKYIKIAL